MTSLKCPPPFLAMALGGHRRSDANSTLSSPALTLPTTGPASLRTDPADISPSLPMDAYLTQETIDLFAKTHSSRTGFCRRLVRAIFRDPNELAGRNVKGVAGKEKIDPLRMAWIRKVVFAKFPVTHSGETEENIWKQCICHIDTLKRGVERDLCKGKRFRFCDIMLQLSCEKQSSAAEKENQGDI
ncbi:MAG: hypothetical protein GY696_31470 [Gammaproteobacteria bacterium]|nr:hypothetical protein [Gammaproteobacteria bacterium]